MNAAIIKQKKLLKAALDVLTEIEIIENRIGMPELRQALVEPLAIKYAEIMTSYFKEMSEKIIEKPPSVTA